MNAGGIQSPGRATTALTTRNLPELLLRFARDPIHTITQPVRLTWAALFTLQGAAAIGSGMVAGAIERSFLDALISIFVFLTLTIMIGAIFTLFTYYFFAVRHTTFLDIRRLHSVMVLATVPYFAIHSFSGYLAPLDLLGFLFAAILLLVALVDQFGLPKRSVIGFVAVLTCIFVAAWSVVQYSSLS